ncbi:unnamed protein product [Cuscuta campestris]|uniref:Uncharacterized protein n=1 Tax=Cuscuta campestris TaxID=132261 RepID=A0A484MIB1_9ASTE|nr:unnamed protein product [Cuscuta campestris]
MCGFPGMVHENLIILCLTFYFWNASLIITGELIPYAPYSIKTFQVGYLYSMLRHGMVDHLQQVIWIVFIF